MPNSKTKPMVTRNFQSLLIIVLFVFSCQLAQAGGPMGGEISYKYVNGIADYEVTLVLYQTASANLANQPVEVILTSSCFGNDTLSMKPFIPGGFHTVSNGVWFASGVNCGDSLTSDSIPLLAFYYRDTVALPGVCTDYVFSYQQCCRDSLIDNLVNAENTAFYLDAKLNTTFGPNTSPQFYSYPRFKFYMNFPVWNTGMYAVDSNNDSVWFRLVSVKDSNGVNAAYINGFSSGQPLPSQSLFGSGMVFTQAGIYSVVVEAVEYRLDPAWGWFQVGSAMREVTYYVESAAPMGMVSTAFGGVNTIDTIKKIFCNDSVISLRLNNFSTSSLTQSGSEFRIVGNDSILYPVIEAGFYNIKPDLTFDSIWVKLHRPVMANDTLLITLKKGTDGNTLINYCGIEFPDSDNGVLIAGDCQFTGLLETLNSNTFSVYPNPAKDKIMIEVEEGETPELITLFDIQGRVLKSIIPQSFKTEIDISKLSKGMYLLEVRSDGLQQTRLVQKL